MSDTYSGHQARRERVGATARILLAQAVVIGAPASLCLFLTTGVNPRSVGFAALACAAGVILLLLRRGRTTE